MTADGRSVYYSTQLAKTSIDPQVFELAADVGTMFLVKYDFPEEVHVMPLNPRTLLPFLSARLRGVMVP